MDRKLIAILGFGLLACASGAWLSNFTPTHSAKARKSVPSVQQSSPVQQVAYQETQSPTQKFAPTNPDWQSRYPLSAAETTSIQNQLSQDDIQILGDLPPVCTSDLPGFSQQTRSPSTPNKQHVAWQSQTRPDMNVEQASPQQSRLDHQPRNVVLPGETIDFAAVDPAPIRQAQHTEFDYPQPNQAALNQTTQYRVANAAPLAAPAMMNPHANSTATSPAKANSDEDPHLDIYARDAFPSAQECATCHQQIYDEWASSSHAYASISPMFHRFEDTINRLAQGTIGYFCLRCHAPVATTMGLRRDQAIWDGPKVFREGVTCVACHRVKIPYGKANGERRMEPGPVTDPVYGGTDGKGVATAVKYAEYFKTLTDPNSKATGQKIHRRSIQFEELSKSTFCMSCHQVAVQPGIKLEVVWDQYRASPAYRQGITCQECHMGIEPGVAEGYSFGPAAVVNDKVVNPERKHSNHLFYGPGYSIAHPGIFPHTKESDRWKFNDWLLFDWRAGWGTEEFEEALEDNKIQAAFPPVWNDADDRYDAREIVDENLKKLKYKKDIRRQLMENGSKLDGPYFASDPLLGQPLKFRYCVTNTNPGHNMPSGSLGAQPQLWLNTVLIGPSGQPLWESGYLDSNGDLADLHSLDVVAGRIPMDKQLFNLQTKFLTTNVKGTDREMYLPVNVDIDQLPFLRPPAQPVSVINHPPNIRMEAHSIPPLGSKNAKFVVPAKLIQEPGTYRLSVRMRSRAEPIYFMRFCKSTPEMERMMNEWICDFHEHSVTFEVR
jgi:nitrate/TMAO reductase-like tetraheme cytochrome c subunit